MIKKKYWQPIHEVRNVVEKFCQSKNYTNIVEVGPGKIPFPLATRFVGYNEFRSDYIPVDIDENPLPFGNKELDFIYSRHVLEDIQNPNYAIREMIRCSKSGYAETPSPLVEITKGVDAEDTSKFYAGYHHHRYIVWSDMEKNEMYFLPKYSCIIDHFWETSKESIKLLEENPIYWNNYFLWDEKHNPPTIKMYKVGVNLGLEKGLMNEYLEMLSVAAITSIKNTDFFFRKYCLN